MTATRVLVVDDSAVIRKVVTSVLDAVPGIEVVGVAHNGAVALSQMERLKPDLITLDIEMPEMDGLETLRQMRRTGVKVPAIMFSTLTDRGAKATIEALTLGARDYVTKPSNMGSLDLAMERVRDELVPKISAICPRSNGASTTTGFAPASLPKMNVAPAAPKTTAIEVVAIGASTGGAGALVDILPGLSGSFPLPIVITQHMPAIFTRQLAERLDSMSAITVQEAQTGMPLRPGLALIAPGDFHLTFERGPSGVVTKVTSGPAEHFCRPSVDVMFRSVAKIYRGRSLTVMLTGMGHDGCAGTGELHQLGAQIIAQDEATSSVWGMPGAVVGAGLADEVVPLASIARSITERSNLSTLQTSRHARRTQTTPTPA
ncbi:MAG: chemotaxis response regulator protein-glutamate methylesterase [Ilumatobacter sp.]